MKRRTVLVFIGQQGSGKGTQAMILADKYGFIVIAPGDLLRTEVAKKTPFGLELADIMAKGNLVPDESINRLIQEALARLSPQTSVVFDGFPRTVEQARYLDSLIEVSNAVQIDIPYEVSVKRISGRLTCPRGHNYNRFFLPPQKPGICNIDKLPLSSRPDDTQATVINRLAIYQHTTTKVLAYYRDQGKLIAITGNASVFAVSHEIKTKVLSQT
ncbi:MAG: hypothetical protein A3B30_00230 [Candidatus Komeilibacteria bacterium RIFCSPLOWO2_01_FULL_52_15]|uniref:Adenylate kinase n=2 Tax=Candidatus Komeiliibacteriota TaxID=1817908 RepID=A0A1G2BPC8_9BACT|nr:MAG: hypothetical protein A2677_01800 [Candidatus Komeilibacteria bacterium RIFCSPHIGHO2_01_FULL_52_14]OGY91005.1 MAG: hypothetical protein A3B30_00230 [Candidatus Komeilibacteria bacterium RIFCSPLOWO2_01_FULL_52_15]